MKKSVFLLPILFLLSAPSYASMSYECYGYKVDGKPVSSMSAYVKVIADSKAEAEKKAIVKYEKNGKTVSYVNCK